MGTDAQRDSCGMHGIRTPGGASPTANISATLRGRLTRASEERSTHVGYTCKVCCGKKTGEMEVETEEPKVNKGRGWIFNLLRVSACSVILFHGVESGVEGYSSL